MVSAGDRCAASDLDPARWESSWKAGLQPLDAPLAQLLRDVGFTQGGARVVYHGPDVIVDVINVPLSGADALTAAELKLRDAVPGSSLSMPIGLSVLSHSPAPADRSRPASTHVLSLADREESAELVADLVRRCGLTLESMTPYKAMAILEAWKIASSHEHKGTVVVFYLGEHRGAIVGASAGRLLFARAVDLGCDTLVDAMFRSIRGTGLSDRARAARLLFSVGFPGREVMLDESQNIYGDSALPLMHPVVQRYAIEIKQTMRFSLTDAELGKAKMVLAGPGAGIKGLIPVMENSLDTTIEPQAGSADTTYATTQARLVPRSETMRRVRRGLNRATLVGAVACGLALLGLTVLTQRQIIHNKRAIKENQPLLARIETGLQHRQEVVKITREVVRHEAMLQNTLGDTADWVVVLGELARRTPTQISLTDMAMSSSKEGVTVTVKGWTIMDPAAPRDPLALYLDQLGASPLIENVALGSSSVSLLESVQTKQFTIALKIRSLPFTLAYQESL